MRLADSPFNGCVLNSPSFFTHRKVVFLLASLCCLLWGSAYPAIKNGYALFHIAANDIPSRLVFAGYRFLFAGLVLLVVCWGIWLVTKEEKTTPAALDGPGWGPRGELSKPPPAKSR